MINSTYLLSHLGVWQACLNSCEPLKALRLIDDCNRVVRAPDCYFKAGEVGLPAFAYNIRQQDLNQVLITKTQHHPAIHWHENELVADIDPQPQTVALRTQTNKNFTFDLIIGADGRRSLCRKAANIEEYSTQYNQTAIACNFTHQLSHGQTSTEFHRPHGPMTFVPMQGTQSSLVWSLPPHEAEQLMGVGDERFMDTLFEHSHAILGAIKKVGPRAAFPVSLLGVRTFAQNKIALIGEAAHVLPPIGAQGLNLGIRDIALLYDCLNPHSNLPQTATLDQRLALYNSNRRSDVWSRTLVVDMLNRSLLSSFLPFSLMRSFGLQALNQFSFLRKMFINEGLKPKHLTPSLLQETPPLQENKLLQVQDNNHNYVLQTD